MAGSMNNSVQRATFPKCERMVSRLLVERLFGGGNSRSMVLFPLRVVYAKRVMEAGASPVQLLISVPKKHFKHAVDRNRVKRQIREAYRHHKHLLLEAIPEGQQLLIACVWLSDSHFDTAEIEQRLVLLMKRVAEKL
jgi:ribonuclease P protein component